ncbi:MAG: flavodoxin family protein [Fusobacterium sp.]
MKVLVINGSPRKEGNTKIALGIMKDELTKLGIEIEELHVGSKINGCLGCMKCAEMLNETCIIKNDIVNEAVQKIIESDGVILSSPTYYANISGTMKSFLDRVFFVAGVNGGLFRHKVGASISSVRRAGAVETINALDKYFTISEMFISTSTYWNMIYGAAPGEVLEDEEGIQTVRILAKNMGFLLKSLDLGKKAGLVPEKEEKIMTNFIR